jgi:hypothetical protein
MAKEYTDATLREEAHRPDRLMRAERASDHVDMSLVEW